MLVGSNAEKILLSSEYPTLTVGRHVMGGIDLEMSFKELVCILDFTPQSIMAVQYAASLGRDLGIRVELLPAALDNSHGGRNNHQELVRRFCSQICAEDQLIDRESCDPAYHFERIASHEEILRRCVLASDSLIVVGVHSESRWNRHLHGSFAYELVGKAGCRLRTVRGESGLD